MISVKQCARKACSFRFPADERHDILLKCPKCGAPVLTVAQYSNTQDNRKTDLPKTHIEVYLDNLRSIFNVGSIFRSSDACGIKKIHLGGITPSPSHPKMAKTALGAQDHVKWEQHWNGLTAIRNMKKQGYHLISLEKQDGSSSIFQTNHPKATPILLIAGNENFGVDPEIIKECDQVVHIPMLGLKESLNVAIAFSIAAYWLMLGAE